MPWGIERINSRKSQPNPNIVFIKPRKGPDEKTAQEFLERIAAQCVPVMRRHHLYVMALEEFEPNREFVGRNFNAGEVIQLVLKSPHSGRWLPLEYVQMVMMHELAHCKQMNHSHAFWAVRNGYASEMRSLWGEGYTGDGIWGRGTSLATGAWEKDSVKADEMLPEHLCGGTFRTRGRKRQKRPTLSHRERKERRIRKRFGENGTPLGADEDAKAKLERGKKVQAKPRVANSDRGRQLRAAAALARFDKVKEESASAEEREGVDGSESSSDEGDEVVEGTAAVDVEGNPLLDSKGRGLVKVCEDEDVDDVEARGEMDELRHVFRKVRVKEESPMSDEGGTRGVEDQGGEQKRAYKRDDESTSQTAEGAARPPDAGPREVADGGGGDGDAVCCSACSLINVGQSSTCAVCANVLKPEKTPGTWRCDSATCANSSNYANSADCGVCGLCGGAKG
ncbi:hypothetical protein XA68_18038 [Ophiocordyceps unilateralis]|uniref:WLM domain-containing protein n=1 Tax=Ophiocordyceps unilateralis TaxID=268505 RepID=A0A2A9P3J4_OPHUN|nr:hypothetical protein XA68_18038 [Ophiocordyceps unilateralis]